jgi:aryl-alcohol dehydrogenase-like predicted oxidoreductase
MAAELNKIALGTVQFGLPYGISNQRGQVPMPEVFAILNFCRQQNINLIDTAAAYGTSESVLGKCFVNISFKFNIISKLPASSLPEEVAGHVNNSLRQLQVEYLYGYLFHDFNTYLERPETLDELMNLKARGVIQKLGFSLYYPNQLEYLLQKNISLDIVQIPFNIFDQRFAYLFPLLQERNIQVHVRSVFLQGLLLTPPEDVNIFFKPLLPALTNLHQLAKDKNIPLPHLCLGFAHLFLAINNLIVGVTSLSDLEINIAYTQHLPLIKECLPELKDLAQTNETFLLPFNWKMN